MKNIIELILIFSFLQLFNQVNGYSTTKITDEWWFWVPFFVILIIIWCAIFRSYHKRKLARKKRIGFQQPNISYISTSNNGNIAMPTQTNNGYNPDLYTYPYSSSNTFGSTNFGAQPPPNYTSVVRREFA